MLPDLKQPFGCKRYLANLFFEQEERFDVNRQTIQIDRAHSSCWCAAWPAESSNHPGRGDLQGGTRLRRRPADGRHTLGRPGTRDLYVRREYARNRNSSIGAPPYSLINQKHRSEERRVGTEC